MTRLFPTTSANNETRLCSRLVKPLPKELLQLIAAALMIFAFNSWEHMPNVTPNHYSDITSVFWRNGVGKGPHLIPYVDYVFEYPAIVGVMVYAASATRYLVPHYSPDSLPDFSAAMVMYTFTMHLLLLPFMIGTVVVTYLLVRMRRGDEGRIWKSFLVVPSFLMFPLYNWDMVAIFFAVASLYFLLKRRARPSAFLLGLGATAKLYPAMLLPPILLELRSWRSRVEYCAFAAFGGLVVNAPFMALNFKTWFGTWTFLAGWGIEDSWLIFLFKQMDVNAHYIGLAVMAYLVYKGLIGTRERRFASQEDRLATRWMLTSIAWLVGSYVVTPQMALMLLPLYSLLPQISLPAIYAADVFNAMIIVLWFNPQLNMGNPMSPTSPVQALAAVRQLIWLLIFVYLIYPERSRRFWGGLLKRPAAFA